MTCSVHRTLPARSNSVGTSSPQCPDSLSISCIWVPHSVGVGKTTKQPFGLGLIQIAKNEVTSSYCPCQQRLLSARTVLGHNRYFPNIPKNVCIIIFLLTGSSSIKYMCIFQFSLLVHIHSRIFLKKHIVVIFCCCFVWNSTLKSNFQFFTELTQVELSFRNSKVDESPRVLNCVYIIINPMT